MTIHWKTTKSVKQKTRPSAFTQSEIQSLSSMAQTVLSTIADSRIAIKVDRKVLWNACNKEDPNTQGYFDTLNYINDLDRHLKAKYKKYSKLQARLKAFERNPE